MVETNSNEVILGTKAVDFELYNPITDSSCSLADQKGSKATVIIFMCNHCPYVLHIIDQFVKLIKSYDPKVLKCIGINSNDVENFPDDSPEKMVEFSKKYSIEFPYLYDESQEVAKSYNAACTPDIYVFDQELLLKYHGRFDDSTPGNKTNITGKDLKSAIECVINNKEIQTSQYNSMGCNIKWK